MNERIDRIFTYGLATLGVMLTSYIIIDAIVKIFNMYIIK